MASSSMRNVMSVLALCEGAAILLRDQYLERGRNKSVLGLVDRVVRSCRNAHRAWGGDVHSRDVERIGLRMRDVERQLSNGGANAGVTVYTSLCLALVSDQYQWIRDPVKLCALDQLHSAMLALNRHWDRKLDRWEDYAAATRAARLWEATEA